MPRQTPPLRPTMSLKHMQSKKLLCGIAATTVTGVVLLAVSVAVLLGRTYSRAVPAYEQRIRASAKTLEAKQPKDSDEYKAYLATSIKRLDDVLASAPKQHNVLWVHTAPTASAERVEQLTHAVKTMRAATNEYRTFLIFRDDSTRSIKDSALTISSIEQARAAIPKLQAAQQAIRKLTPPRGLASYQQAKVAMYNAPIASLQAAVAAYDSHNTSSYAEHVEQLRQDMRVFDWTAAAEELLQMHQYYQAFSAAYDLLTSVAK